MCKQIINELKSKYKKTGRIGFMKPESEDQATKIIQALAEAFVTEKEQE